MITSVTKSDLLNVLINRYLCVTRTMTAEFWTYSVTCPCEPITFSQLCARSGQHLSLSVSLLASHLLAWPLLQPTPSALIFIKSESRLDTIAYRITCCVAVVRETFASYTKWSAMAVPPSPPPFFSKLNSSPGASGIAPKAVVDFRMLYKRPQYLQQRSAAYCQITILTH